MSNNRLVSPPSHDSVIISNELQGHITLSIYKDIQETFNFMESSIPPLKITDRDIQHWLRKSTTQENSELWRTYYN